MKKKTAIFIFCASVLLVLPGLVSLLAAGEYGRSLVIFALFVFGYIGLMRVVYRQGGK